MIGVVYCFWDRLNLSSDNADWVGDAAQGSSLIGNVKTENMYDVLEGAYRIMSA